MDPATATAIRLKARLASGESIEVALQPGAPVVVGRAAECPIVLTGDGRASRHHAAFELRGAEVWVRDLGSRNGTFVNGARIVESRVAAGDDVRVGGSAVRVELPIGGPTILHLAVCGRCSRTLSSVDGARMPTDADGQPICGQCAAGQDATPRIAGFRIEREVGRGGMGRVYLARDSGGRAVALKVLVPPRGAAPVAGVVARFAREAKALQALSHPGAVACTGAGESDGHYWIAMEFVAGPDYDKILRTQGRVPVAEALGVGRALCECLAHAHQKGIVHRDIKPSNILRADADGRPRLTDFGLARLAQQTGLSVQSMSAAGIGSPLYVPPEQILAIENADHRSDLYALAATLFHLMAGRPVFEGAAVADVITQVLDTPPPELHAVAPDVPKPVSQALAWALEKDPSRRYASAADMGAALESAAG